VRVLIICLIFVSVPLFGESGFELWLEGAQTSNSIRFPGFGMSESANSRLVSVRGLWFFRLDDKEYGVSLGQFESRGEGIVRGSFADPGVTYAQSLKVHYQSFYFFGLHYRVPGKTTFTYSVDARNCDTWVSADSYSNIGSSTVSTWELAPSVQATWNLYKRFHAGLRLAYRFQLTGKDTEAHWFDEKQNHPEFGIVAGWRFGRS